jgi:hypothetical protein
LEIDHLRSSSQLAFGAAGLASVASQSPPTMGTLSVSGPIGSPGQSGVSRPKDNSSPPSSKPHAGSSAIDPLSASPIIAARHLSRYELVINIDARGQYRRRRYFLSKSLLSVLIFVFRVHQGRFLLLSITELYRGDLSNDLPEAEGYLHHVSTRKDASDFHPIRHARSFASIHEPIGAAGVWSLAKLLPETRLDVEFPRMLSI